MSIVSIRAKLCSNTIFQGAHVVDHVTSKKMTYDWIAAIYAGLDELSNDATANMTEPEVIGFVPVRARSHVSFTTGI